MVYIVHLYRRLQRTAKQCFIITTLISGVALAYRSTDLLLVASSGYDATIALFLTVRYIRKQYFHH